MIGVARLVEVLDLARCKVEAVAHADGVDDEMRQRARALLVIEQREAQVLDFHVAAQGRDLLLQRLRGDEVVVRVAQEVGHLDAGLLLAHVDAGTGRPEVADGLALGHPVVREPEALGRGAEDGVPGSEITQRVDEEEPHVAASCLVPALLVSTPTRLPVARQRTHVLPGVREAEAVARHPCVCEPSRTGQASGLPSTLPESMHALEPPDDCVLMPLRSGRLLVSRRHATFCRIQPEDVPALEAVLRGANSVELLGPALHDDLERHGFFGPPRECRPSRPSVQLQLTNACNLACSYCCTNSGPPRLAEMDRTHVFALLAEVREILGPGGSVGILGGEAFLLPWAMDVAERVVDVGLALTVFTNGTPFVDEQLARRMAAADAPRGGAPCEPGRPHT